MSCRHYEHHKFSEGQRIGYCSFVDKRVSDNRGSMSAAYCCGEEGECPYIAYRKEQARQQQRELERQSRKENIHNGDGALSSVFYITGGGFANLTVGLFLFTAVITQLDRGMSDLFYTLPPLFLAFSLCMVRLLSYPLFFGIRDRIHPYIGGVVAICSILIIIRCMDGFNVIGLLTNLMWFVVEFGLLSIGGVILALLWNYCVVNHPIFLLLIVAFAAYELFQYLQNILG